MTGSSHGGRATSGFDRRSVLAALAGVGWFSVGARGRQPDRSEEAALERDGGFAKWPTYAHSPRNAGVVSPRVPIAGVPGDQWTAHFEGGEEAPGPFAPTVVDGSAYVATESGVLAAVDAYDGTERWSVALPGRATGPPTVGDGRLYLPTVEEAGSKRRLQAFDASDGTELWTREVAVSGSPALVDGTLVCASESPTGILALGTDGRAAWRYRAGVAQGPIGSVAVSGGVAYLSVNAGLVLAVAVGDGTELWRYEDGSKAFRTPVFAGDSLYTTTQEDLVALEVTTGERRWRATPESGDRFQFAPVATDEGVYVAGHERLYGVSSGVRQFSVLPSDPETGQPLESYVETRPILVGETLLVRLGGWSLLAYDTDGEMHWHRRPDGDLPPTGPGETRTLSFAEGRVYFGAGDRVVSFAAPSAPPLAAARATPTDPRRGESVSFDAGDSAARAGEIRTYRWSFEDGVLGGETVQRSFETPGEHEVELVVEATNGRVARDSVTVTVRSATATPTTGSTATATRGSTTPSRTPAATAGNRPETTADDTETGSGLLVYGGLVGGAIGLLGLGAQATGLVGGEETTDGTDEGAGRPGVDSSDATDEAGGSSPDSSSESAGSGPDESADLATRIDGVEAARLVDSGGYANVYHARMAGHESPVALKLPQLHSYQTVDQSFFERFVEEARLWAKVDDHPNVVTVHDWGRQPVPWIALEYVSGGSFRELVGEDPATLRGPLVGFCEALAHAHSRGVVHADLKPENVLVTDARDARVGDWGLARFLLEQSRTIEGLTPRYAAPEQLEDGSIGAATDVYQAGAVAYHLLAGRPPFDGDGYAAVVESVLAGDPTPPSEFGAPPMLDEPILSAMASDPDERLDSVLYLRDALQEL